jgi:hypothetical protein
MKTKKAIKRLTQVEVLLSTVMDKYAAGEHRMRELLDAAKESVFRAKETVSHVSQSSAQKAPVKVDQPKRGGLTAEGRKRISRAAKKRWAVAKRKGVHAVTGHPLGSKTA